MGLVVAFWFCLNVILVGISIWLPAVQTYLLPLAITLIIAMLLVLVLRQREQKEILETRLGRLEALLREKIVVSKESEANAGENS